MKVEEITEQEFYQFMESYNGLYHFIHDEIYYDYIKKKMDTFLLGLKKDDELIGVSLLSAYRLLKLFNGFSTHFGPLLKYFNNKDFEFFIQEINKFVQQHNALEIRYSPNVIYQMRDPKGKIIEDDPRNNREIIDLFLRNGFVHHGFTKQLIFDEHLRYQAVVDIRENLDSILKNMDVTTRYNTRQAEKLPLRLKYLSPKDYPHFVEIYKDTEERVGFDKVPESRIYNQLEILKNKTYVVLSQIDLNQYIYDLKKEIETVYHSIENLKEKQRRHQLTTRKKRKLNEQKDLVGHRKNKLTKTIKHKEKYGSIIDLSVGMYYFNNNEMVYLFSGSYREHARYLGTNFVTWEMIKKAKELGLKRFNMYGITGNFHKNASDYGVFKFKQGFNAEIEELPGTFTKIFHPFIYKLGKIIGRI